MNREICKRNLTVYYILRIRGSPIRYIISSSFHASNAKLTPFDQQFMRILFLTQIVPYPPNSGPKVKTWNVLRFLYQQGYRITLVSFVRPEEEQYIQDLEKIC